MIESDPGPAVAPAAVSRGAASIPSGAFATPAKVRGLGTVLLAVLGIVLGALALLIVAGYLVGALGTGGAIVAAILALVPLVIVILGVRWVDRWEPEPRAALVFAFLWGAGVSVLIALVVDGEIQSILLALGGAPPGFEFFQAAIQAPLVEEFGKGVGVLLLFWAARRHFDGPVDGVVYAASIAAGFAFTENVQYFGVALAESGGSLADIVAVFTIRGLMSPFAHVMFTALTGIALGIAARRVGAFGAIGYFALGLAPAMLLHAFWNGALFFVDDFFGYYAIVQVPLFIGAVLLVRYLRGQEQRLTGQRLAEYAAAGWFNPDEITAIATPAGRRLARSWADRNGVGRAMRRYIHASTRLALARQRLLAGRGGTGAHAEESALLTAVLEARRGLSPGS